MTASGVLPPYTSPDPTIPSGMSPYTTTTLEMAQHFCKTSERLALFQGFLTFRQMLRALGFTAAWQWVDGSFCEDCEILHSRPPKDIDIITLYRRPPKISDAAAAWKLIVGAKLDDRNETMKTYNCDAYWVDVDHPAYKQNRQLTYWFGLMTHQRVTNLWKGILSVELGSNDDDAKKYLSAQKLPP
jgi:hypothetical protein